MLEIRIHGRGGQGAVTAAELIAVASWQEKKSVQAFPFFGVERRGAPVEAFVRIDDEPIKIRSQVYQPNFLIIQDETLIKVIDVFRGLRPEAIVLINSGEPITKFTKKIPANGKVFTVPATDIALRNLGKPILNTALLGAFAAATNLFSLDALKKAIRERFVDKDIAAGNINAAKEAFNFINQNYAIKK